MRSTTAPDQTEFHRMVIVSVAVHVLFVGVTLAMTRLPGRKYVALDPTQGPLNVLWATTVQSPEITAPNKLPGPQVMPEFAPEAAPLKPRIVLPDQLTKTAPEKVKLTPKEEEAERRRAMAEALASIRGSIPSRPTPRPENFPSSKQQGNVGIPAGPGGGAGGILGGNPIATGYYSQIRQIITDNLLWIQKGKWKALAVFRLDAQGNILSPSVAESSGSAAYDNAVIRAVRKSSPLPPPPDEITRELTGQEFAINFNIELK